MKKNKLYFFVVIIIGSILLSGCPVFQNLLPQEQIEILVPIFNSTVESKAIIANQSSEDVMYGSMFLPQLSYFEKVDVSNLTQNELTVKILHFDVKGSYSYDENTGKTYFNYDFGDDAGYIEVIVDQSGNFTYKQYLLVNVHDEESPMYMYCVTEYNDGHIQLSGKNIGNYTANGQLYYGTYLEGETSDSTVFNTYDIGQAKTYIHGTSKMIFGFVDPYTVRDESSFENFDLLIANKAPSNITINDFFGKIESIRNFKYEREENRSYPFNDYYYNIVNDEYYGQLSQGSKYDAESNPLDYDLRESLSFEKYTGYTYNDLGLDDSNNIFELLGNGTEVDYTLIGNGELSNWNSDDNIYYCNFTVEQDGVYMTPPGFAFFDENKINLLRSDASDKNGILYPLKSGVNYNLGLSKEYKDSIDVMKNYSYLYYLGE